MLKSSHVDCTGEIERYDVMLREVDIVRPATSVTQGFIHRPMLATVTDDCIVGTLVFVTETKIYIIKYCDILLHVVH